MRQPTQHPMVLHGSAQRGILAQGQVRAKPVDPSNPVRSITSQPIRGNQGAPIIGLCLIDAPLTRHKERYAQVLQDAGKSPTGSSADEEEARKIITAKTPLRVPWIEPEDVAPVVVFLASDAARMVSGATCDVTGGDSARNTA